MSLRNVYMGRFVARCLALAGVTLLMFAAPEQYDVLESDGFFSRLSLLHVLWAVWLADMLTQLVPATKAVVALGSQKSFRAHYRPTPHPITARALRERMTKATKRAYIVFLLWAVLIAGLGILHGKKILGDLGLFWISCFFYVCDLICVLFWCPFRHFIMKNRCCVDCRIFDWGYFMMYTPMLFIKSFFSWSLFFVSCVIVIRWELIYAKHPERFWEGANTVIRCANCEDKLCKIKRRSKR